MMNDTEIQQSSARAEVLSGDTMRRLISLPQFRNLGGTLITKERFESCDYCSLVYSDNQPVSLATLKLDSIKYGEPELPVFYTLPRYRGRGFGFAAFQRLLEFAQEKGIRNIHIDVTSTGARKMIDALTPDYKAILNIHDSGLYLDSLMPQIEQVGPDKK